MKQRFSLSAPVFPIRAAHLDLKGVPPTFERLLGLLEVFAAARYNAVLVEWEDTFPWTVDLRFRCETAYTPQQIRQFMKVAAEKHLEVIPLVQCLGHMETPLAVPDYAHLREVPDRCDVLNPLAPGAGELVASMVDDVLSLCPQVRYLHLGGDEAWTFGAHPDTRAFIQQHGKDSLYLRHVGPLLEQLGSRGIRPILWHDMMIHWSSHPLARLAESADLMVWGYTGNPDTVAETSHYHRRHIDYLKSCGVKLWCAGAYKGGSKMDDDLPDFPARSANAVAWAHVHEAVEFQGAVAAGWSRYDTTNVQTCPIDSSLDSLVNLAHIFHDGQPMPGDQAGCADFLGSIGEGSRFGECRRAMKDLAQARARAWANIIELREMRVTARQDPRRRISSSVLARMGYLRQHLAEAETASTLARQAFAGLVPSLWIERYLAERIEPLLEQQLELATAETTVEDTQSLEEPEHVLAK